MKKIIDKGKKGKKNQTVFSCITTISIRFKELLAKMIGNKISPKETS
jgi:hypothetical protein